MLFPEKKEKFQSNQTTAAITTTSSSPTTSDEDESSGGFSIMNLVFVFIFFFAIYLSFKCNNGFSVWGFLGASLFSPIYIIYKLTSTPKMCGLIN
jgi:hypothetical protein